MITDYTPYIIAAYAIAGAVLIAMTVLSICAYKRAKALDKDA